MAVQSFLTKYKLTYWMRSFNQAWWESCWMWLMLQKDCGVWQIDNFALILRAN